MGSNVEVVCALFIQRSFCYICQTLYLYIHTPWRLLFLNHSSAARRTHRYPYSSTRICPKHDWILTLGLINDGSPISNFQCSEVLKQKQNERNVSVQFESTDIEGANCSNWSDCPSQLLQIRQTNYSAVSRCASIS